jgi:hypothetical protein
MGLRLFVTVLTTEPDAAAVDVVAITLPAGCLCY